MIHYIEVLSDGTVIRAGTSNVESLYDLRAGHPDGHLIEIDGPFANCNGHYWDGHALKAKPARPSEAHDFNATTKLWVVNAARAWALVRERRDALLAASDWTDLPNAPVATKAAWAAYRQALRDITTQSDPLAIVWPTKP